VSISASAVWVALTNRRDTADREVEAGLGLDLLADRLGGGGEPAAGRSGEHPGDHGLGEQVVTGEGGEGLQRHLGAVGGTRPRAAHRHPAGPQRHRAGRAAVTHHGPVPVVPAADFRRG
jgi:hypothetical protein